MTMQTYSIRLVTLSFAVALLATPTSLADTVYVGNGNNTIERFTPGGVGSVFGNTGSNRPEGLAFDSAGNLYVAYGNTIGKFTPGGIGSVFATNSGLSSPQGLAFDGAGNLYAANANNSTIEKFTPSGVASVFATNSGLSSPRGLAFDSAGNLYAANANNNTIEKFTPAGVGSVFANSGLSSPQYIAIIPEPMTWAMLALGSASLLALRRRN